jgi:hypothetical protein
MQENYKEAESARQQLSNEINKLTYIIKEAYDEIEKSKKDHYTVVNERDILGT